jgi:predicted phage baseplate assembly protein
VIFGDGEHGTRLPTGQENVVARYRSGIGPAGEVGAHTLIVLPQRPPGVASVDNPFAAGGASPPETLAEARANASLAVVTLDRVVALRDYQDFARAYGGISKAHASVVRGRTSTFVVVTVAGTAGKEVPQLTLDTLRDALDARRDRAAEVLVLSYDPKTRFRVAVEVLAAPERDREVVKAAVKEALRSAFAVDRRDFGQAVTVAEVTSLVQGVPGVLACRVTELRHDVEPPPTTLVDDLLARDAWFEPGKTDADPTKSTSDRVVPAELLLVNPDAVHTGDMAP